MRRRISGRSQRRLSMGSQYTFKFEHKENVISVKGIVTWGKSMRIILDNLKSGILRTNSYDPVLNRAYRECAKHFGFIIGPAKIARGDHKGKVERKPLGDEIADQPQISSDSGSFIRPPEYFTHTKEMP